MAREVQIKNKVYNKEQLDKVVDRNFSFFTDTAIEEDQLTVDEFFVEYDRLYYEIPVKGETNSHEFLAARSIEISNYDQNTQNIEPLLDEIATLRQELLTQQELIIDLQTQLASD